MMCSQGRSLADEGMAGRFTSEWHQGQGESVCGGGGWPGLGYLEGPASRQSWVWGGGHSEAWQQPQHLNRRPAGTTADRAEGVCVSCKPKVNHVVCRLPVLFVFWAFSRVRPCGAPR
jgi:hypothetical protein